jgi:hypothetical protein
MPRPRTGCHDPAARSGHGRNSDHDHPNGLDRNGYRSGPNQTGPDPSEYQSELNRNGLSWNGYRSGLVPSECRSGLNRNGLSWNGYRSGLVPSECRSGLNQNGLNWNECRNGLVRNGCRSGLNQNGWPWTRGRWADSNRTAGDRCKHRPGSGLGHRPQSADGDHRSWVRCRSGDESRIRARLRLEALSGGLRSLMNSGRMRKSCRRDCHRGRVSCGRCLDHVRPDLTRSTASHPTTAWSTGEDRRSAKLWRYHYGRHHQQKNGDRYGTHPWRSAQHRENHWSACCRARPRPCCFHARYRNPPREGYRNPAGVCSGNRLRRCARPVRGVPGLQTPNDPSPRDPTWGDPSWGDPWPDGWRQAGSPVCGFQGYEEPIAPLRRPGYGGYGARYRRPKAFPMRFSGHHRDWSGRPGPRRPR